MKYVFITLLLFISIGVQASKLRRTPRQYVALLDKALLEKDTAMLNWLLDNRVEYGHSNGWIETKRNVIDDLYNGKLVYQKINTQDIKEERQGKISVVRFVTDVDVLVDNVPVKLKLAVLQIWKVKYKDGGWHRVLIARQSVKI